MRRCLELAKLGCGNTAPNPMVGSVLVHDGRIIGEGYHQQYSEAHAEVNCIGSVTESDQELIAQSTLYVSLEPCAHFGKTPPCADLIVKHKIPNVVIGCRDPFREVNGKGIEKLQAAGIDVATGIMENECRDLNKRFFTFHTKYRPYIILKWAETRDGFIAPLNSPQGGTLQDSDKRSTVHDRLLISNEYSNRLVHKWRSEEAAILVGTNTALMDNPELTTRLWPGHSPVRLVLDMNLRLPAYLKIFNREVRTIVFNSITEGEDNGLLYFRLNKDASVIHQIMDTLYRLNIQSVLVEGGAKMLQSFIEEGCWDEARVITNQQLAISDDQNSGQGLKAPLLTDAVLLEELKLETDIIKIFKPKGR
jgi:diaminohydroxyphosphoribosylaminopyrimidine deaminase / 5-amino-6-(5-phosphoribosylamino)uracil reductase